MSEKKNYIIHVYAALFDKVSKRGLDREILEEGDSESVVTKRVYKSVTKEDILNN